MADFTAWIAAQREAAIARGGKPLRNIPRGNRDPFPRASNRKRGEIINPVTGEIVTGCLTISKLSDQLGLSSQKVTNALEQIGAVVRALTTKDVPMICAPEVTKPRYERVPQATREGLEGGLVVPITFDHGGRKTQCVLITPEGQAAVWAALKDEVKTSGPRPRKVETKTQVIRELLAAGHSQGSVVRQTGWPKQTVSRLVKTMEQRTG
ncbi:hypothetical protein [Rhizobium sp. SL42]|uniref:hypothetical protein n=1 Tax=Rhizobium sp. SL42 TaxID=2806346 RepID=UPI001F19E3F1|nr:hypothetical protein [Rhizobium sp. SL42]UJW75796.1 hypothetical protein IM739_04670 [Rhizobium sp. SL42]